MPVEPISQIDRTHSLDQETTDRVLAEAADDRVPMVLHVKGDDVETDYSGAFVGWDDGHLVMSLTDVDPKLCAWLPGSTIRVNMEVSNLRYEFTTQCTERAAGLDAGVIRVLKPGTIFQVERRRSPRRRLHERTTVILRTDGVDEEWRCAAAMLNLSPDGIACRVLQQDAELLEIGQIVRVEFRLSGTSPVFDPAASISNITHGGTPGKLVVGLEFIADQRLEKMRGELRATLDGTSSSRK